MHCTYQFVSFGIKKYIFAPIQLKPQMRATVQIGMRLVLIAHGKSMHHFTAVGKPDVKGHPVSTVHELIATAEVLKILL